APPRHSRTTANWPVASGIYRLNSQADRSSRDHATSAARPRRHWARRSLSRPLGLTQRSGLAIDLSRVRVITEFPAARFGSSPHDDPSRGPRVTSGRGVLLTTVPVGWSGWSDSNRRSRAPKARAMPGFATPRSGPLGTLPQLRPRWLAPARRHVAARPARREPPSPRRGAPGTAAPGSG